MLGISWFWFYGAIFLAQFPTFTQDVLGGDEHVVTLLLALFSVGIGVGSLLCERLSGRKVEIGLVPFGSIGLTRVRDRPVARQRAACTPPALGGVGAFLADRRALARRRRPRAARRVRRLLHRAAVRADPGALASPSHRSRIIAANNILNALFMVVVGAASRSACSQRGLSIPQLFLVVGADERASSRSTSTRWCPSS